VLPRSVQTSLLATQLVAFATLARSVAYDRWFTVVISSLMIIGALAAVRHRTWGVVLSFATAVTLAVVSLIGIAPMWFVGVGAIGALPFLLTSEALGRFDRQATALLAGMAAGVGASVAVAWKLVAWNVFVSFPMLWPSERAQHGLAVSAVLALAAFVTLAQRARYRREEGVRVAAEPALVRIADVGHTPPSAAYEEDAEADEEAHADAAIRRRL
jgi:hypothetical protein